MRPILAAGIAGIALGFVAILDQGVASMFDFGYLFVTFVGVLAGVVGTYYLDRRRDVPRKSNEFDDPEHRYGAAVPGDDIDERIGMLPMGPSGRGSGRGVRERLREAAVRSLVVHAGYGRTAARDAVDNGEWTDDSVAANFLADGGQYPPGLRLKAFFGLIDLPELEVHRSVEAIVAVMGS